MLPRSVYLDHAATTAVDPGVRAVLLAALDETWGNPSSLHGPGVAAAALLERSREALREAAGSPFRRVVFTSGGTEANNLAVLGLGRGGKRRRLVSTPLEHASVLAALERAAEAGAEVVLVPVGPAGEVDVERLADAARDASLVAVHLVHNELGTVVDLPALREALSRTAPEAWLHVDAVQALGKLELTSRLAGVGSVALTAHKIHGPKGAGALLVAGDSAPRPQLFGGEQQGGVRPGTENVPGAAAFAEAVRRAEAGREAAVGRLRELDRRLRDGLEARGIPLRPLAPAERRVPGLIPLAVRGLPSEVVLHRLEARGVYCSAGSACHARRPRSAVLDAIGAPREVGLIRVSLGRGTTEADVDAFLEASAAALAEVRA